MPIEVQPAIIPHLVVDDAAAAIEFYITRSMRLRSAGFRSRRQNWCTPR